MDGLYTTTQNVPDISKRIIDFRQDDIILAFIQISDSCCSILEGDPEGEALLLTFSICKFILKDIMLYVCIDLKTHCCGTFLLKFKHPVLKIKKPKQS